MKSISPSPIFPAVSSQDGGDRVGDAGRDGGEHVEGELQDAGAEAQGEEQIDEGVDADAVLRKALPSPYMPTISEIRQHKTNHLPYRSWCDECVEAFAREWPHLQHDGAGTRTIPVIHMDYACLTEKGLFRRIDRSEEERKHAVTVIVVYCGGFSPVQ